MSAFLGPIHYWLYRKIELQEELVDQIIILAENEGMNDLKQTLLSKYGEFDRRPLEEIIDGSNIHGWLQDKVARSEYKLAIGVTTLVHKDVKLMEKLKEIFSSVGEEKGSALLQEEGLTLESIYQNILDSLLDGMPCDHAISIVKTTDDELVWKTVHCVHAPYWNEIGGDVNHYYELREAYLNGFAKALGVSFEVVGEKTYAIKKA